MNLVRLLFLLSLLISSEVIWADESKFSGNFLGLQEEDYQNSSERILEFWGYHSYEGGGNYDDTLKLRYYQPLTVSDWKGTLRLDTSYVSSYGPSQAAQSTGQYSAGNTLLTIWGNHPDILPSWGGSLGGRIIFPFGNNGQWAIGPQVGSVYKPTEGSKSPLSDFSPLARYMYGFGTNNSTTTNPTQSNLLRSLYLYPTLGFNIAPQTQIRFWDENGVTYNSAGGGWFIPLDAMVTHRLDKNFLVAIGAAKQVVQTYQQYDWMVYGKISLNF